MVSAWTVIDRCCGVGLGLMASLTWRDRIDVLRRSAVLRGRQGWGRLRTAVEVVWFRHALRGRVRGLPIEIIEGETWHRIDGKAAARRVAAGQRLATPSVFIADIYIRTEHTEPAYVRLDHRRRVTALMFIRVDDDGTYLLETFSNAQA